MWVGLNPFLSYGLVGVGAAAYSPAKYGILSELVTTDLLVKANGLLESSTIAAILVGAVAGGMLADWSVWGTLGVVTASLWCCGSREPVDSTAAACSQAELHIDRGCDAELRSGHSRNDQDAGYPFLHGGNQLVLGYRCARCGFCWWPGCRLRWA